MPWCPQCGAEYREGVSHCAECGVALQVEPPGLPRPGPRRAVPGFLGRLGRGTHRAWGYGREAARVLRRFPALLLIPFALAIADTAEMAIGRYASASWAISRLGMA